MAQARETTWGGLVSARTFSVRTSLCARLCARGFVRAANIELMAHGVGHARIRSTKVRVRRRSRLSRG